MPEMQKSVRAPESLAAESDETLMLRFRNQDDIGAFEALVHRYERPLYNYLYRYLRNAELAEEAFQGAFSRVHEKRDLYTEGRRFRPWLYSIATNQAIDEIRREGRHDAASLEQRRTRGDAETGTTLLDMLQSDTPSPYEQMETAERSAWTRKAVDDLPEHLRTVVLLIYFQGLKYREAADVLEIPVGTVKSRLNTAIGMLNEAWRGRR
jgi:RNA polymerase sigma-70 factor, ECF subfamily